MNLLILVIESMPVNCKRTDMLYKLVVRFVSTSILALRIICAMWSHSVIIAIVVLHNTREVIIKCISSRCYWVLIQQHINFDPLLCLKSKYIVWSNMSTQSCFLFAASAIQGVWCMKHSKGMPQKSFTWSILPCCQGLVELVTGSCYKTHGECYQWIPSTSACNSNIS